MRALTAASLTAGMLFSAFVTAGSMAAEADVVGVEVVKLKRAGDATFRFRVTVAHPDTGWDHYADAWEVVGPDGAVLGRRVLLHPHVNEQPFTRSADVEIPESVVEVTVRARDKVHGFGGAEITVAVPHAQ
jgi:hypothetical protein